EVTWFHNDNKLSNTPNKHKQTIQVAIGNNYNVTLEISNLAVTDTGAYKIIAKNKVGEITANVNLNLANEDDTEPTSETEK
ncbi:unnamed protein product, partial [Rotaria magnacalcarata]